MTRGGARSEHRTPCHLNGSAPTSKASERSRSASCCSPMRGSSFAGGGYVGVDVFFVISGFLITQLLVGELDRRGRVSLARFYARRVKRLMPQVADRDRASSPRCRRCCSPRCARRSSRPTSMAAGAYVMNWRLSADAVDYFAGERRPAARPLLVAGGRGAVLPRVAAAAARRHVAAARPRRRVHRRSPSRWSRSRVASLVYAIVRVQRRARPGLLLRARPARGSSALGGLLALLARRPPARAAVRRGRGVGRPGGDRRGHGRLRRHDAVPGPGGAAADARRRRAARRRHRAPLRGADAGAHAAAAALRRPGVLRLVRLALAGARLRRPPRGGRCRPPRRIAVVAGIVRADGRHLPLDRGAAAPLEAARPQDRGSRSPPRLAGPALAVAVGVALSASISSPPALAAREAVGRAAAGDGRRRSSASATALRPRPRDAGADRGRAVLRRLPRLRAEDEVEGAASTATARSKTTVVLFGDSHAMQYFPALREDRAAPPLAAGGADEGRLPAAARAA